jgi:hypothetical protein
MTETSVQKNCDFLCNFVSKLAILLQNVDFWKNCVFSQFLYLFHQFLACCQISCLTDFFTIYFFPIYLQQKLGLGIFAKLLCQKISWVLISAAVWLPWSYYKKEHTYLPAATDKASLSVVGRWITDYNTSAANETRQKREERRTKFVPDSYYLLISLIGSLYIAQIGKKRRKICCEVRPKWRFLKRARFRIRIRIGLIVVKNIVVSQLGCLQPETFLRFLRFV